MNEYVIIKSGFYTLHLEELFLQKKDMALCLLCATQNLLLMIINQLVISPHISVLLTPGHFAFLVLHKTFC